MTMAVGGLALHWGGACNRFSEEDLRLKSLYGLAADWPIEWAELERYYCEAERRAERGRRTEPASGGSPIRSRIRSGRSRCPTTCRCSRPGPSRAGCSSSALPMARNLEPFGGRGGCCVYDTCGEVCPSGARYSPDFTFRQLMRSAKQDRAARSHARPAADARRAAADDRRRRRACTRIGPARPVEYRAKTFVVASGYCWSSHLLLLSANSRFPNGLANSSGLVGRYMNGHPFIAGDARTSTIRRFPVRT